MSVSAVVFDITRGSFHDGPGVRDVVYLKGCPMRCRWCHNPEGLSQKIQLSWAQSKCIGCSTCVETCPQGAFSIQEDKIRPDFSRCLTCGKCVQACPTGALSICGREMSADEVMEIILKDRDYFDRGGGVTFSGGECLIYPSFMEEILRRCKENHIHSLIESALNVPASTVASILPLASYLFADLKHADDATHSKLTGVGNQLILQNIRSLASLGVVFSVRTPVIPEMNDDIENLTACARLALESGAQQYVLLRYNPLGESKYRMIGQQPGITGKQAQEHAYLQELSKQINQRIGTEEFVIVA